MSQSKINTIIVSVVVLALILVGYFLYVREGQLQEDLASLEEEVQQMREDAQKAKETATQVEEDYKQYKKAQREREKQERLVKKILSKDIIRYGFDSGSGVLNAALILQDKDICDLQEREGSKELCRAVFNNECAEKFDYPNREICAERRLLLKRKTNIQNIKSLCNDQEMMDGDMAQSSCYQYFAAEMNKPELCEEICKNPIDNTNCGPCVTTREGETISCAEDYRRRCLEEIE